MTAVRALRPGDEPALHGLLSRHAGTSMFLRSNIRAAGLAFAGDRYQAHYFGAFEGRAISGVLALCWNGMLLFQAPEPRVLRELFAAARAAHPGFEAMGFSGDAAQAAQVFAWLAPPPGDVALSATEGLFQLALSDLQVPAQLQDGTWSWRRADDGHAPVLAGWSNAYEIEALGRLDTPELAAESEEVAGRWVGEAGCFVVEEAGVPLAMACWNARLPDMVQIGGVFTPPRRRGRGLARAAVAAALLAARDEGVQTSILFTGNPAAERAYRALGYERCGDYHIALFHRGVRLEDATC